MIPVVRKMSVVDSPGDTGRAMIRISNKFLESAGFTKGSSIEVQYYQEKIVINKINNANILQTNPLAVSGGAEAILQRTGQPTPCASFSKTALWHLPNYCDVRGR